MITQIESGLTVDQYNALKDATSGASWSLTAHKYNLDFSEVGSDQGRDNDTPDFDAAAYGNYIYRIVGDLLERYDTGSEVWTQITSYTGLPGLIDTDSPNIVVDGSAMYIYAASNTGIHIINTTDNAASFSAWTQIVSDEAVNKIAAVNKTRIHYTQENSDKNIFQLRVAKYSGSWAVTESDIYYTFPFSNFVAAELPDGGDMIVAATEVPGITTVKLVVNVPTKYIKQQGGIIGFKYKNDWWGDHYDIDVVDELTAYRFRDRIKLTQFSDRVALTCYSSDGTQLFPYTMYRIYTTKNGKDWSKGNALPLPDGVGSSGAKLCQLGDYVYAVEKSRAYKSLMTLYLGYSPSVCQLLIPHRRIQALSLSEGDMMQGTMTLSNEDGWLDSDAIISPENRTVLVMRMGYWVNGENFQVQTNMAEIDTYDRARTLPRKMVRVTFRDFLSWMTDINSAERPYYWDSQLLGGDNFVDSTNDKYGGLRHLEPQAGSFTSENSNLNLTSNNEEGVGFSTFSLYLWNGITQSQFTLSTVGNLEYGGVTFRSIDKDNFWTAFYYQGDDKIRLVERSAGVGSVKEQTGTLSWASTPLTPRWLQVEFRYAHIIVRYSTDGLTWTDCIDYLMDISTSDVAPDGAPVSTSNKERGYVGFIGKGYAPPDVESWPTDPPPYVDPPYYPQEPPYYPPYNPNYPGPYEPGGSVYVPGSIGLSTTGNPKKVIAVAQGGEVWRTKNLNANTGTATWEKAFTIPGLTNCYAKDPKKPNRRWFGTQTGLYVCENIWAAFSANVSSVVSVQASGPVKSTNIGFKIGDLITISASGTWFDGVASSGPTGRAGASPNGVTGSQQSALIGRIGTVGSYFYIGSGISMTADKEGILNLRIDDDYLVDDSGSMSVTVTGGHLENTVPFSLRATSAAMFNNSQSHLTKIMMSEKRPNWLLVQNTYDRITISENLGYLWDCITYTDGSAATGVGYDQYNSGTFDFWRDGIEVPFGSDKTVVAMHGEYDGSWHYRPYVSSDWGRHWTSYPRVGIGSGGYTQAKVYIPYRRVNNAINVSNSNLEVWYTAQDGPDGLGVAYSTNKGHSMDTDVSLQLPPGLAKYNYGYGGAGFRFNNQTTEYFGDQGFWTNPKTYKRRFMVIQQFGYANPKVIIWSDDNFSTSAILPGFALYFAGSPFPIHLMGYVNNLNFLMYAQEGGNGGGGYPGFINITPDLGVNWFAITPPYIQNQTGYTLTDTEYYWAEARFVAIDCEA